MASPFVELIIQSMQWLNILLSLGIILISFNPTISKIFRKSKNVVYILLLWASLFLSIPIFVPSIYQYELFLEILRNYATAALPVGPLILLIINWKTSSIKMKDVGEQETDTR